MSSSEDYCVVGSGPAGISCVQALLAAGKRVTILGPGLQLEPDRERARATLAASDPSRWASGSAFLREGVSGSASGIPLKLAYGSEFPYRQVPGATSIACDDTATSEKELSGAPTADARAYSRSRSAMSLAK